MAHVSQFKKDEVKEFTRLIDEYPIVGIVNMQNLPTKQLQVMRAKLRDTVLLRMTKTRLIRIAFDNSKKPEIDKLKEELRGMPALLFTKENPFSLFSTLKKNKSKAPISGGQTTPNDIVVPAGKTNFTPGPVIAELGSYGVMAGVEDGKIAIKEDKVVAKEGDVVDAKLAGLLQRLGIEPMEIGLDLIAVYENGEILTKDVLDIDEDKYKADFMNASSMAFNLAVNIGFPTAETVTVLIQKAVAESKALVAAADIMTDENVGDILAKAESQANTLNSKLDIKVEVSEEKPSDDDQKPKEVSDTPTPEVKEEAPAEEKKEKAPVEEKSETEEPKEEKSEEVEETKTEDNKEEDKPEEEKKETSEEKSETQDEPEKTEEKPEGSK